MSSPLDNLQQSAAVRGRVDAETRIAAVPRLEQRLQLVTVRPGDVRKLVVRLLGRLLSPVHFQRILAARPWAEPRGDGRLARGWGGHLAPLVIVETATPREGTPFKGRHLPQR